jgi:glycosyltransferase involved in cell wall biosynthesis
VTHSIQLGDKSMVDILVSINCITYNHGKYIEAAIQGFLNQKTTFKYEILIHDDASTDSTSDMIRKYQKQYPHLIKAILEKENQMSKGISRMNYVFNHSRSVGKYIALCEGDDYWTDPYKLQKQVNYMEQHPDCGLCFHATEVELVGEGNRDRMKPYKRSCISPTEDIIRGGGGGYVATSSILYRKVTMDHAPSFFWNAPTGDYPLQLITSVKNYAFYINEFMSVYRSGVVGSWTSTMSSDANKVEKNNKLYHNIAIMLKDFDKFTYGKYSDVIQKQILITEIHMLITNNKLFELTNARFRKAYSSFTLREKIYIKCRIYKKSLFPKHHFRARQLRTIMRLFLYPIQNKLNSSKRKVS